MDNFTQKRKLTFVLFGVLISAGQVGASCHSFPEHLNFALSETSNEGTLLIVITSMAEPGDLTFEPVCGSPEGYFMFNVSGNNTFIYLNKNLSLNEFYGRDPPLPFTKEDVKCNKSSFILPPPKYDSTMTYELRCKHTSSTSLTILSLEILKVKEDPPYFMCEPYVKEINELMPVSSTVFVMDGLAASPHVLNTITGFSLIDSEEVRGTFEMIGDKKDGIITIRKPLDYNYGTRQYALEIYANDSDNLTSNKTTLFLDVTDGDDQNPVFTSDVYIVFIPEENDTVINTTFSSSPAIVAFDLDFGINATLSYVLLEGATDHFIVDASTAEITPLTRFDREVNASFTLTVEAFQIDNPLKRRTKTEVKVIITDINDNAPEMTSHMYNVSVPEYYPDDLFLVQISATDDDEGINAVFHYEMLDPLDALTINNMTGEIFVKNSSLLDRETRPFIDVLVSANETYTSEKFSSNVSLVRVTLIDVNDNNPVFYPQHYFVNLSSPVSGNTVIGQVYANDTDEGDNGRVTYVMISAYGGNASWFDVHPNDGSVYTRDDVITRSDVIILLTIKALDNPAFPLVPRSSYPDAEIIVRITGQMTAETTSADQATQVSHRKTSTETTVTSSGDPSHVTVFAPTIWSGSSHHERRTTPSHETTRVSTGDSFTHADSSSHGFPTSSDSPGSRESPPNSDHDQSTSTTFAPDADDNTNDCPIVSRVSSDYYALIVICSLLSVVVIALVIMTAYQGYMLHKLRIREYTLSQGRFRNLDKSFLSRAMTSETEGLWSFESITAAVDQADFVCSDSNVPAILPKLPVTNADPGLVGRCPGNDLVAHETVVLNTSREVLFPTDSD